MRCVTACVIDSSGTLDMIFARENSRSFFVNS